MSAEAIVAGIGVLIVVAVILAAMVLSGRDARKEEPEPLHPADREAPADLIEPTGNDLVDHGAYGPPLPYRRAETQRRVTSQGSRWWSREFAKLAASAPELNTADDNLAGYYLTPDKSEEV